MPTVIEDDPFVEKVPCSALRHRTIQADTTQQEFLVLTPRASQPKSSHAPDIHTTGVPLPRKRVFRIWREVREAWLIYLILGMLMTIGLLWIGQLLWNWGNTVSDDLHYGRPRTTNVNQFVGHETGNTPSHFVAVNLNGQVYVMEIPGGSTNASHLLIGPHLIGSGADLAPVSLSFLGDPHHPDLLITVNGIQVRFHNTGDTYVPM